MSPKCMPFVGELTRLAFTATLVAILLTTSAEAQVYFHPKVDYPIASSPFGMTAGDIDDDGDLDLVATHGRADSVSVYLGRGDGFFDLGFRSAVDTQTRRLVLGKFNADRYLDIALPDFSNVAVGFGDSLGRFTDFVFPEVGEGESAGIATGLIDGDAHLDIVVTNGFRDPGFVYVLRGNGDGTFQPYSTIPVERGPLDVVLGEFTGDDALDMIVGRNWCCEPGDEGGVTLYPGLGDGTFDPGVPLPSCLAPVYSATGDVNGDTHLDIVSGCADETLYVLTGSGTGTFFSQPLVSTGSGYPSVALADFNGDQDLDVAVALGATFTPDSLLVYGGLGNGNFVAPQRFDVADGPWGVTAGDFNGDTYPDLVTASEVLKFSDLPGAFSVLLTCPPPCQTTAISAALQDATVVDGAVRLRWIVPSSSTQAGVYRRMAEAGWQYLGQATDEPGSFVSYEDPTVEPGIRYAYRIHIQDQGEQGYSSEVWITVPGDQAAPLALRLDPVFPNPLEREARFNFAVPRAGKVSLEIFSVTGQRVATIIKQDLPAGWRLLTWDGRDAAGQRVASGTYFARLESAGETRLRKVVVAR